MTPTCQQDTPLAPIIAAKQQAMVPINQGVAGAVDTCLLTPVQAPLVNQLAEVIKKQDAPVTCVSHDTKPYTTQAVALLPRDAKLSILKDHIPNQSKLNSILQNFRTKVLHSIMLPITLKELADAYSQSPRFKDVQ